MKARILFLALLCSSAMAQVSNPPIIPNTTPPGSCTTALLPLWLDTSGILYTCQAGVPTAVGGGSASSVPFSGVTAGTNANALIIGSGGSLTVSGTGTNNATAINGTALSGLASGLLYNTTTTGVPSIATSAQQFGNLQAPAWLRFFGTGSEGAYSCPSGTCNLAGEHWYTSVNVAAGAIVAQNSGNGFLIMRSTGTCTIAGTVSVSANTGSATGGGATGGSGGGSGGGGGGGTGAGTAGGAFDAPFGNTAGGTAGNSSGGTGGTGVTQATVTTQIYSWTGPSLVNTGAATIEYMGGSAGGAGGTGSAAGGKGGGVFILTCPTIAFTGTVDASGANGTASAGNNNGGGGGGGGGWVIMATESYSSNSGTITTGNGTGGGCGAFTNCGAGGPGGSGWSKQFTIQ